MSHYTFFLLLFLSAFCLVPFIAASGTLITIRRQRLCRSAADVTKRNIIVGELKVNGQHYGQTVEILGKELAATGSSASDYYDVQMKYAFEGEPCPSKNCLKAGISSEGSEVDIIPYNWLKYATQREHIRVGAEVKYNHHVVTGMKDGDKVFDSLMSKVDSDAEANQVQLQIVEDYPEHDN